MSGAYTFFITIPQEIENKITENLNQLGFKKVVFQDLSKTTNSLVFEDISLDSKSFSGIKSITVKYSLWSYLLQEKRAESITIQNLHLTGDINDKGALNVAGWKNDGTILNTLVHIPSKTIFFENSTIELLTPSLGGIKIQYNGTLRRNSNDEIEIVGRISTKQKTLETEARISGTINEKGNLQITAESENIHIETPQLKTKRANIIATFIAFDHSNTEVSVEANAGSAIWYGLPLRDTNATLKKNEGIYQIYTSGKTAGSRSIEFSGLLHFRPKNIDFESTIYPETFQHLMSYFQSNKVLSQSSFAPSVINILKNPTITMEGSWPYDNTATKGTFKISSETPALEINGDFLTDSTDKKLIGQFKVHPSKLTFTDEKSKLQNTLNLSIAGKYIITSIPTPANLHWAFNSNIGKSILWIGQIPLSNIQGTLGFNSLKPDNFSKLSFALPLTPWIKQSGEILLDLNAPESQTIQNILLNIYNGTIETGPVSLEEGRAKRPITLTIGDISLSEFIQATRIVDLYITGKIGGKLPLEIKDGKLHLKKALLQSQQSGIIQIPENITSNLFAGPTPEMQILRKALKNYHYEFFEIRMDGPLDGGVMLSVIAHGSNPDYKDQTEMAELKFQIETKISNLFKDIIAH